jgi:hypothetical protein
MAKSGQDFDVWLSTFCRLELGGCNEHGQRACLGRLRHRRGGDHFRLSAYSHPVTIPIASTATKAKAPRTITLSATEEFIGNLWF